MSAKHTPGPWKVNSFSGPNLLCCGSGVTDILTEEGDERVSVARVAYRDQHGDFGSRNEQKANARLIAIAPEMVEEIREMAADDTPEAILDTWPQIRSIVFDFIRERRRKARALLARLDGKE